MGVEMADESIEGNDRDLVGRLKEYLGEPKYVRTDAHKKALSLSHKKYWDKRGRKPKGVTRAKALQKRITQDKEKELREQNVRVVKDAELGRLAFDNRQAEIANLWYQGYSEVDLVKKLGYSGNEVRKQLGLISQVFSKQTQETLKFRRKKLLGKIELVQKKAWRIHDELESLEKIPDYAHRTALLAIGRIISSQELEAKVEGITYEKPVGGAEREATKLLSEILELEKKTKTPVPPVEECEEKTPLPDFLKGMETSA